jgi:hypothetical protein
MITPDLKDKILKTLIDRSTDTRIVFDIHDLAKENEIGSSTANELLKYFEEKNLLHCQRMMGGGVMAQITVDAFDFIRYGGFVGEEQLMNIEFEKLKLEIESLKTTIPKEKFDVINGALNTVMTFLALTLSR